MARGGVYGLDRFSEYMKGLEDCYAIIGGAACSIILDNADLEFRATKDIDVILLFENRFPEAAAAIWKLIRDGGYTHGWKSSGDVNLYRFAKPRIAGFPAMVELFSKAPSFITEPEGLTIVPLPAGGEVSSLSAILLDDDYYAYMKSGRMTIDGVTVLDAALPGIGHVHPNRFASGARLIAGSSRSILPKLARQRGSSRRFVQLAGNKRLVATAMEHLALRGFHLLTSHRGHQSQT